MVKLGHCLVPMLVASLMTSVTGTKKKGVCLFMKEYKCNDTQALHDVSWWYDWGTGAHSALLSGCPYRGEFVPMVWGYWGQHVTFPTHSKYLLGFNEPNHKDQSHMTPKAAAAHWQHIQATVHGVKMVSPAPARCVPRAGSAQCTEETLKWLDDFFAACHNCTIDYVAVHSYTCGVENDMRFLETVHARYKKPVWLTEFACPRSTSLTHVEHYMRGLIPRLERAPFVYRYSWYQARIKHGNSFIDKVNSLLEPDSSKLTPLGRLYNSLKG